MSSLRAGFGSRAKDARRGLEKACGAAMLALPAFSRNLTEKKGARGRWPSHLILQTFLQPQNFPHPIPPGLLPNQPHSALHGPARKDPAIFGQMRKDSRSLSARKWTV
jgi:hypothetical protein